MTDEIKFYLHGDEFSLAEQSRIAKQDPDMHRSLMVQAKYENARIRSAKDRATHIRAASHVKKKRDLEKKVLRFRRRDSEAKVVVDKTPKRKIIRRKRKNAAT